MTKFANPEMEDRDAVKQACLDAVAESNSYELARLLGLKYEGSANTHQT